MSALCVITARGGSKRIPRKNIRDFCGKPIIAYSIEAALESGLFDEVMVSTDDEEIAEFARRFGANVPFMRSEAASDDYATTADVIAEVLEQYRAQNREFDVVCCIYPTAPFVTGDKLIAANKMLVGGACDSVLTAVRFSFPPQRGYVVHDGVVDWWMPENAGVRSQDLEPVYHDAGQFYFATVECFEEHRSFMGVRCGALEVPEAEAQDIDNESDWTMAEMKYECMVASASKKGER